MKHRLILVAVAALGVVVALFVLGMSNPSPYDMLVAAAKLHAPQLPDGSHARLPDQVKYPDNQGSAQLLPISQMKGYTAKPTTGTRVLERLMTFHEFADTYTKGSADFEIGPNRMIWVWVTQIPEGVRLQRPDGGTRFLPNAQVTTYADAATGDPLGFVMRSADGSYIDEP